MGLLICVCWSFAAAEPTERKWYDSSFRHSTVASFVAVKDDSVTLKKQGGETIVVPMNKLCEECKWIVKAQTKKDMIKQEIERLADERIAKRALLTARLAVLDDAIEEVHSKTLTPDEELKRQVEAGRRPDPKPEYRRSILNSIEKDLAKRTRQRLEPLQTSRDEVARELADPLSFAGLQSDMKVGDVGTLRSDPSQPPKAIQILGPRDMLISYRPYDRIFRERDRFSSVIVLIRGMETAGLADDAELRLEEAFMVTGTHAYDSVGGSRRTVFVAEPLGLK